MTALDVLIANLRARHWQDCETLAESAGLPAWMGPAGKLRNNYHHGINAEQFLGLCAIAGVHPLTGESTTPKARCYEMCWPLLGAGFRVKRGPLSLRAAAEVVGVSSFTLSRLEAGQKLSVESLLHVCKFMDVDPRHYAHERHIAPRETTPNTLNQKDAA